MIKINQQIIEGFTFPGGEVQVNLNNITLNEATQVDAFLDTSHAIMKLLMAVDAIRRVKADTKIHLHIPYFPYARQDRVCNTGEALAIRVMTDLINGLQVEKVTLYDPHSDVTGALLNNVEIKTQDSLVTDDLKAFIVEKNIDIISPDAGAEKKALKLVQGFPPEAHINLICGSKQRDTQTGKILATSINGEVKGKNVMIVDDICDGGRTFIELSKVLKAEGAKKVYLYVTHGIFSKGTEVLEGHFDKVFCYFAFPSVKAHKPQFLETLNPN